MQTRWEELEQKKAQLSKEVLLLEKQLNDVNTKIIQGNDESSMDLLIKSKIDLSNKIAPLKIELSTITEVQDDIEHEHWQLKLSEMDEEIKALNAEIVPFRNNYNDAKQKFEQAEKEYEKKSSEVFSKKDSLRWERLEIEQKLRNCKRYNI